MSLRLIAAVLLMVSLAAGQTPVCSVDADCAPAICCSPSTCVPVGQKPDCSATACLAGCQPGTLDCGGTCYCSAGQCQARLNNITYAPVVADECRSDADCGPADCCHSKTCAVKSSWPECAAVSCSAECEPGTLDCGGSCSCVGGKCLARLNGPPAVPNECNTDEDCGPTDCCHSATCSPLAQLESRVCNVACTFGCVNGTTDCGGSCKCQAGRCLVRPAWLNESASPSTWNSSNTSARDVLMAPGAQSSSTTKASVRGAALIGLTVLALLL